VHRSGDANVLNDTKAVILGADEANIKDWRCGRRTCGESRTHATQGGKFTGELLVELSGRAE
jgi:hypothetical protein